MERKKRLLSGKVLKRFEHYGLNEDVYERAKRVTALSVHHRATKQGVPLYGKMVKQADEVPRLLIDGVSNRKTGGRVIKGPWAGAKIVTLTLPERSTCPTYCYHWLDCYGNAMPFARRVSPFDAKFHHRLMDEVAELTSTYDKLAVRLHVLGDFFSSQYTWLWYHLLNEYDNLHLFGYTARKPSTPIGKVITKMNNEFPRRCVIRWSSRTIKPLGAITIDSAMKADNVVTCPAQTGKTKSCGTCGLCWSPSYKHGCIAFVRHGRLRRV